MDFRVPEGNSKQDLVGTVNASARTYLSILGLIRKYHGIAEDGKAFVGVYPWNSKKQARWRSPPTKQEWSTPMVVERQHEKLLTT